MKGGWRFRRRAVVDRGSGGYPSPDYYTQYIHALSRIFAKQVRR